MRKTILVFIAVSAVLMSVSCSGGSAAARKNTPPAVNYRFNYTPYENLNVSDRDLYNYVFNIVRNKLAYYVQKTLVSAPEPLGMVLELDAGGKTQYQDVMNCGAKRGWSAFDTDVIPLPDEDVKNYNAGSLEMRAVQTPKACFSVRVAGNTATVYVRYWILQYASYHFIHTLTKSSNWSVTGTELVK